MLRYFHQKNMCKKLWILIKSIKLINCWKYWGPKERKYKAKGGIKRRLLMGLSGRELRERMGRKKRCMILWGLRLKWGKIGNLWILGGRRINIDIPLFLLKKWPKIRKWWNFSYFPIQQHREAKSSFPTPQWC